MSLKAGREGVNAGLVSPVDGSLPGIQPKQLSSALPIANTTKDTVESFLASVSELLTVNKTAVTDLITGASFDQSSGVDINHVTKIGNIVFLDVEITGITANAEDVICKIPTGFTPGYKQLFSVFNGVKVKIDISGSIVAGQTFSNGALRLHVCYYKS